jgi:hypothetical protein
VEAHGRNVQRSRVAGRATGDQLGVPGLKSSPYQAMSKVLPGAGVDRDIWNQGAGRTGKLIDSVKIFSLFGGLATQSRSFIA